MQNSDREVNSKFDLTSHFFNALYENRPEDRYLLLWTPEGSRSHWFRDVSAAAEFVSNSKKTVYFQVALSGADYGPYKRCSQVESDNRPVTTLPALFADVDFGPDGHKGKNYPPTIDDAIGLLKGHGFDPSMIVHSGHGLHAYWVFKEPWELDSADERSKAATLLNRLKAFLQENAAGKGWTVDSTQDLPRILRPPGSWNCKGEPVQVKILEENDARYNHEDLEEMLPECVAPARSKPDLKVVADDGLIIAPGRFPPSDKYDALQLACGSRFIMAWNDRGGNDNSPSGYDLSLANLAAAAGWTDQEIIDLLIAHREHHGHDLKLKNRQYYIVQTIPKARKWAEKSAIQEADERKEVAWETINRIIDKKGDLIVNRIIRYEKENPAYKIVTNLGAFSVPADTLDSQLKTRRAIFKFLEHATPRQKPAQWELMLNQIRHVREIDDLGPEAKAAGQIRSFLERFLKQWNVYLVSELKKEDWPNARIVKDSVGNIKIQVELFKRYIRKKEGWIENSVGNLYGFLSEIGLKRSTVKIENTSFSAWKLPADLARIVE